MKDAKTDEVTRASLVADFAQLGRRDLNPLFISLLEKEGMGLDTLTRVDLDYLFDSIHCPSTCHYDLEGFYNAEKINATREGSEEEKELGQGRISKPKLIQLS